MYDALLAVIGVADLSSLETIPQVAAFVACLVFVVVSIIFFLRCVFEVFFG